MDTKLTLRLNAALIEQAKRYSRSKGQSVSKLVEDYFRLIADPGDEESPERITPRVARLRGALAGSNLDKRDYRRHLEEKYR